jgi:2-haloacid dehalogenase/putative hydrolase of the HAD superfamily
MSPQAVLLDHYGTIVHEDHNHIMQVCEQVAAAAPQPVTASEVGRYWSRTFGALCTTSHGPAFETQRTLARRSLNEVLAHFNIDLDPATLSQPLYDYWGAPALYKESVEVLNHCALPICLVSNIDRADLQRALVYNGLIFDRVVTSEDCRAYKPRHEMFACALEQLEARADQALYVGDSLGSDVRGAREAGIPVMWINRRGRPVPSGAAQPNHVARDLTAMLELTGSTAPTRAIAPVETAAALDHVRALFVEYAEWIGIDLGFQHFQDELDTLPGAYAPPSGRLLLARYGAQVAGCVALRPLEQGVCELKRLYVRPDMRGAGIGQALVDEIAAHARTIGYSRMRLDTLPWMDAAIGLYRSLGFGEIALYRHNPIPGARYFELVL